MSATSASYGRAFFEIDLAPSLRSARRVAPAVLELIPARRVVDVGCGTGAWLKAFLEAGVPEGLGLDGAYVDPSLLLIPKERFRAVDLERGFEIEGRFDLAVCLEVAEHVSPRAGEALVDQLTRAAPAVLFSAAVPGQGGTHHVNEQWPDYWARRFEQRGFVALDVIRPRVWRDDEVSWWYRQNTLLYVRRDRALADPRLAEAIVPAAAVKTEWVHAAMLRRPPTVRERVRRLPGAAWARLRRTLRG